MYKFGANFIYRPDSAVERWEILAASFHPTSAAASAAPARNPSFLSAADSGFPTSLFFSNFYWIRSVACRNCWIDYVVAFVCKEWVFMVSFFCATFRCMVVGLGGSNYGALLCSWKGRWIDFVVVCGLKNGICALLFLLCFCSGTIWVSGCYASCI